MQSATNGITAAKNNHENIRWWHSIDLGNGIVTQGHKSPALLAAEFDCLQLTEDILLGKRILDVGCADGYFSLECEKLGGDVVGIDGIYRDSLKYIRERVKPKFKFYCMDLMSPSFSELGRFDVILYLGVLYHTVYPYEQLVRLASACNPNALLLLESEYYDLAGFESEPTLMFNYDGRVVPDKTSPVFPSIRWIEQTLSRIGFQAVNVLRRTGDGHRGRVTIGARYPETSMNSPILYAAEQAV
jgi:tRNA (mo5U34)-methyltransferase